jgi:nickel superoxide dismutase
MFEQLKRNYLDRMEVAEAHCDAPCGIYDPSSARISAEAALSMTKKILDLKAPDGDDPKAAVAYKNTLTRYIFVKEEQAQIAKDELLILWTDYFKPVHWKNIRTCTTRFGKPPNFVPLLRSKLAWNMQMS